MRQKKLVECQRNGHLLEDEKVFEAAVAKQVSKERKDDSKRKVREVETDELWRNISESRPLSFFHALLSGKNVWYEDAGREKGARIRENAVAVGANLVTSELQDAEVFLVKPTAPQPRASWHAVLGGGVLVSEDIYDVGERGFAVAFHRATDDPLCYHATEMFQDRHDQALIGASCGRSWQEAFAP